MRIKSPIWAAFIAAAPNTQRICSGNLGPETNRLWLVTSVSSAPFFSFFLNRCLFGVSIWLFSLGQADSRPFLKVLYTHVHSKKDTDKAFRSG